MDWNQFFEKTSAAADVHSNAELAAKLGCTKAAISHYRTGKRVPPVWTVAACLKLQGVAEPEKEAARIMTGLAHSPAERAFWRKLGAAAALAVALLPLGNARAAALTSLAEQSPDICIMRSHAEGFAASGGSYPNPLTS